MFIILDLHFWTCLPRLGSFFGHVKHQTAVAALGNAILQREFKKLELLDRDDIAGTVLGADQCPVVHLPSLTNVLLLIIAPSGR